MEFDAKHAKKEVKNAQKSVKAEQKMISKKQLVEYKRKVHQMDMDTLIKIRERQKYLKSIKVKNNDGVTNNLGAQSDTKNAETEKE